ncbi:MAG: hypothetical protein O2960_08460 [Verrucomicrobia bacterium]|nr:hypothetical protein [Verrucomicrobiota bacterium]
MSMDRDQAKKLLIAYRAGLDDSTEPGIAEALALAKFDPAFADWLRLQTNFHSDVRRCLRAVQAPPGLRRSIRKHPVVVVRPIWRRAEWISVAAGIVLLLSGIVYSRLQRSEANTLEAFRARMIGFALREYRMDIRTSDLAEVRRFLAKRAAPNDFGLTAGLESIPVMGGGRLSWRGNPVAMVCFALPENETAFLFVVHRDAFSEGTLPGDLPEISSIKRMTTAEWSRGRDVFLLAARVVREEFRSLTSP